MSKSAVFINGTSLGSNECTFAATRTRRAVDGILGVQASMYGPKCPIPPNVKYARLFYSYVPIPWPLLGAYQWRPAHGFHGQYVLTSRQIPHPGDGDDWTQREIIADIKRLANEAGADEIHFFAMYGMGGRTTDMSEAWLVYRVVKEIPGIHIHGSPYRDYQVNDIAAAIDKIP
jgi:hypothetical protein